MPQVAKIATPGYNALTDTDPDHFALYVDQKVDYVLIKEKASDTVNVPNGVTNIAHRLDYVPLCFVWAEQSSGVWRKLYGYPLDGNLYFEINDTNLMLNNFSGSDVLFSYHIFYDNIT